MTQSDNFTLETPLDFTREAPPAEAGLDPQALARLASLFEAWIATPGDRRSAGQLVIAHHGRVAFDRAVNADPTTPFLTFSVTKAFTGVCIHRLLEEGRLEWDAPVARYWPEFGSKGKETATIRHVFLHQAGIPGPHLYFQALMWPYWDLVTRDVARTAAVYPPGSRSEYHLLNYGFIFGKVIENVTGMPFSRYLRQTVLDPLGLAHTWLPIPPDELRCSPHLFTDSNSTFMRGGSIIFSLPRYRRAIMPAATLHSTARDLAVFYQMLLNGGTYAGQRILKPETVAAAARQGATGVDGTRWAHGFHLGPNSANPELNGMGWGSTPRTFGHFGLGTSMAWADPDAGLVVTFTCNYMLEEVNGDNARRLASLSDIIWDGINYQSTTDPSSGWKV
jgi:CubicO group peptidase (beta-lactamase class C family)